MQWSTTKRYPTHSVWPNSTLWRHKHHSPATRQRMAHPSFTIHLLVSGDHSFGTLWWPKPQWDSFTKFILWHVLWCPLRRDPGLSASIFISWSNLMEIFMLVQFFLFFHWFQIYISIFKRRQIFEIRSLRVKWLPATVRVTKHVFFSKKKYLCIPDPLWNAIKLVAWLYPKWNESYITFQISNSVNRAVTSDARLLFINFLMNILHCIMRYCTPQ